MNCQIADCNAPAAEVLVIYDVPRNLCQLHAAAAEVWLVMSAPDLDQTPHHQRPCALCREGERAPGRACCWECISRAYTVDAEGTPR